jgi:hypothetical protein
MRTNKRRIGIGVNRACRLLLIAGALNAAFGATLVDEFKASTDFSQQLEIAKRIVQARDRSVLPQLTSYLAHEDRHIRGNAALIFGGLGDPRGCEVITAIVNQRGYPDRETPAERYYALQLLGELKDPKAVAVLVPLLGDPELNYRVPWALGQIGGNPAIGALIQALQHPNADVRIASIYALLHLSARESLPYIRGMLDDDGRSNFNMFVTVSGAANAAIKLMEATRK